MIEYLLALLYFLLFLYIIKKAPFFRNIPGLSYKWIVIFFSLKVFSGVMLSLIYKHYYEAETADIYKYFNDGLYLYGVLRESPADFLRILTGIGISQEQADLYLSNMSYWFRPWESPIYNDNRVIIRFNAIVCLFSFGHLHVHTVFANLLSLTGLVALYKFLLNYLPQNKTSLLKWGVFLFPSLLFWGSGVLKEAVLIGCLGLAVFLVDSMMIKRNISWGRLILLTICLWVLVLLKPYILVLFLPCIIGFYISLNKSFGKIHLTYLLLFAGLFAVAVLLHLVSHTYSPINLIARKQNDLINLSLAVDAGSLLHENYLKPELTHIISRIPEGFINAFFRPHIFESGTPFMLFAAFENLLIILMIITAVTFSSGIKNQPPTTFLSFWFCLAGLTFIGLITPVAGAIVRYKIIMLPFIWVIFLNLINDRLLESIGYSNKST